MEGRRSGTRRSTGAAVATSIIAVLLAVGTAAHSAEPYLEPGPPAGIEYAYGDEVSTEIGRAHV